MFVTLINMSDQSVFLLSFNNLDRRYVKPDYT